MSADTTDSRAVDEAFDAPRPAGLRITHARLVSLKTVSEAGSLEPAWEPGGRMTFRIGGGSYLELHTDQGLVGIGPAMDPSLLPIVNEQLAGKDPFDVEAHAARLQYYGRGRPRRGSASGAAPRG